MRNRWSSLMLGSVLPLIVLDTLYGQTVGGPRFVTPAFAELTIKRHSTTGGASSSSSGTVETLYLKGARQRREFTVERRPAAGYIAIAQCDERRTVDLNTERKIYGVLVLEDPSERLKHVQPVHEPPGGEPQGAEVTTTSDAVDTGERRRVGRYVARRVRTTVIVTPGAGANTPASTTETDGWYIDLPGLGCLNMNVEATVTVRIAEVVKPGGLRDRHAYKTIGRAQRGYPIEETTRFTQDGISTLTRIELIAFSDDPLDPALFEIPTDYRPALPLPHGGYDMTKPDTLAGRLQTYWNELALWTRAVFQ